jgi:peptide/nickel transport system substrate-binding protein/oligopeptide transport system substrate-binding protein
MVNCRGRALTAAALSLLALAAGCGGKSGPSRHALVDSRDTYDPRSLDPALSTDVPTGRVVAYLFDGLTRFEPDATVKPSLADRWDVSPDGITYTFHLHQGVLFQNGQPLTSRDVVASWTRVLLPATKSGSASFLYSIRGARAVAEGKATTVSGLSAPNDSTVVVQLEQPFAIFPKLLAMPMASVVPAHPPADLGQHPIGSGPWKLVEWKHDDYLLFARNPHYFAGPPQSDTLRARIIAEPSTAVAEFESGNVDVLEIPPEEAEEWVDDQSRTSMLRSTPSLEFVYVALNTTRGPLVDRRVRQAIACAVDIDKIIERLVGGRGTRAAGVIPPSLGGYDSTRKPYPYDPARAKRLLAESGHPNGIDLELWTTTTPRYVRIAETIQAYLQAVGIRTKIVQRESAASRAAARKGVVDMILKDWYADYPDAEDFLYPLLDGANRGAGGNLSFYENPVFDSTVAHARLALDQNTRNQLYRKADSIAFVDAPLVGLYFYDELYAVQPWIRGFEPPVIYNGQRWLTTRMDTSGRR